MSLLLILSLTVSDAQYPEKYSKKNICYYMTFRIFDTSLL